MEESEGGAGAEGYPDPNPGHHHVGHNHSLFMMGFKLTLSKHTLFINTQASELKYFYLGLAGLENTGLTLLGLISGKSACVTY